MNFPKKTLKMTYAILQFADLATTYVGLNIPNTPFREKNPLMHPLMEKDRWGILFLITLAEIGYGNWASNSKIGAKPALITMNLIMAHLVLNNSIRLYKFYKKS